MSGRVNTLCLLNGAEVGSRSAGESPDVSALEREDTMGRLSMNKAREILRQKLSLGRSHREVAESVGASLGVVSKIGGLAKTAGLDWAQVAGMDDGALELALYGPREGGRQDRPIPDCVWIHTERKKVGVTLELLHLEYLEAHPDGYRYTQFCEYYRRWLRSQKLSMRQVHRAGEKLFVDDSGKKPHYIDPETGEAVQVELFVAVLGASNYTYAEASRTQQGQDFIGSHLRAFEFLGGVPDAVTCDQLKSGVTIACRYEPGVQRTYEEMARHYGCTVLPARPRKPKDKAKVEAAVQVAQRWILARLRKRRFFSLGELNEAIWELLEDLNDRPMKGYGGKSRRQLFEEIDAPELSRLPPRRFVYGEWTTARVNIDYHIDVDGHFYSVPHAYRGELVDARVGATTVEVFFKQTRIASHRRSYKKGRHTTHSPHMPKAHRRHLEWSPSRFLRWAEKFGPNTRELVRAILDERPHPEQGYRSCLGILSLSKRYPPERLEAACRRAVRVRARSYRPVATILKNGLDRLEAEEGEAPAKKRPRSVHENVRGPDYYH